MSHRRPVQAAIFDMDGLLIDSEPFWHQSELEIFSELGLSLTEAEGMPDTLGLRIDQVVSLWYDAMPWTGPSQAEVAERIIARVIARVEETRPLLPGVREALELCKREGLKIGLASASPLFMLERMMALFDLRGYFDVLASAGELPYSKPHPQVYLDAARGLGIDPLNCVTLEDSFNGMIATKAARMRSIVVPAAENRQDARWALADVQLGSLAELTAAHLKG